MDLTVPDAERTRRFYKTVIGWSTVPQDTGGYAGFSMTIQNGEEPIAGISSRSRGERNAAGAVADLYYRDGPGLSLQRSINGKLRTTLLAMPACAMRCVA